MERYIKYDAGADAYIGRTVSGLSRESERFGLLPPHFVPSGPSDEDHIAEAITTVFPTSMGHSPKMQSILRFCLASLLYHDSFLAQRLPTEHDFTRKSAFSTMLTPASRARLKGLVQCCVAGETCVSEAAHWATE